MNGNNHQRINDFTMNCYKWQIHEWWGYELKIHGCGVFEWKIQ